VVFVRTSPLPAFPASCSCRHISPARSLSSSYHHGHYDTWIWDSCIASKLLIDTFAEHSSLRPFIEESATASPHLHGVVNAAA
jgi:hypothetical protein